MDELMLVLFQPDLEVKVIPVDQGTFPVFNTALESVKLPVLLL